MTSIEPRALRDALGCFATGITIVSTRTAAGESIGITVNSFNSVSLEPPLVLYSLARSSSRYEEFLACEHFAINVLDASQRDISSRFATHGVADFSGIAHTSWSTGAPIIERALAVFECDTDAQYDGGDHVIIIGRVRRVESIGGGSPLLYYRGAYASVAD